MSAAPVVSFLLPVAAPAPFLAHTLRSLLAQSDERWNLVLVFDGPADAESQVARDLVPRERLTVRQLSERGGIADALNVGLASCTGRFVARIDGDDVCRPDRLSVQLAALSSWPECVLVGSSANLIDEMGRHLGRRQVQGGSDVRRQLLWRNQFIHSSVLFLRDPVMAVGGYDPRAFLREDYDLWLRLATHSPLGNLADDLVDYRLSAGQSSRGRTHRDSLAVVGASRIAAAQALGTSAALARVQHLAWVTAQSGRAQRAIRRIRGHVSL